MTGGIHTAMHDGHSNHTCVGLHCGTQTFVSKCFMITYTLGDFCGIHKIPFWTATLGLYNKRDKHTKQNRIKEEEEEEMRLVFIH